jgi:hypothetical protein
VRRLSSIDRCHGCYSAGDNERSGVVVVVIVVAVVVVVDDVVTVVVVDVFTVTARRTYRYGAR